MNIVYYEFIVLITPRYIFFQSAFLLDTQTTSLYIYGFHPAYSYIFFYIFFEIQQFWISKNI